MTTPAAAVASGIDSVRYNTSGYSRKFRPAARLEPGKWYQPDLVEHWIEGLRKAGPEIPGVKKEDQK
jgi:hypothetical protein